MLRENQREALKEINARTQPLSLDHLDVSCAILADAILSLAAATAPASSASSPSTTGPSAKPLPSPGASHVTTPEPTTGRGTLDSSKLAQSGTAGESLEAAAVRYLQE